jgi:hypothetical protein
MAPERSMLARNKAQLTALREKLAALEAKAEKYQKIIEAPGKSEQTLVDRIADLAKRFIESGPDSNGDDSTAAARAQMQLLVEKAAESATAALDVAFALELLEHLLRRLIVRMDDTELSRILNEVCLRLEDRREGLIEIRRHFGEILALLGLRRQPQRDPDLVHISKSSALAVRAFSGTSTWAAAERHG